MTREGEAMHGNCSSAKVDAHRNARGRRSFLGASIGAVVGGIAAQPSPLSAQDSSGGGKEFFPGFQRRRIEAGGTTISMGES
jgi:hypothetical protein